MVEYCIIARKVHVVLEQNSEGLKLLLKENTVFFISFYHVLYFYIKSEAVK